MNKHLTADSLKTMIGEAYSRIPDSDPVRLNMIERRVIDQIPAASRCRSRSRVLSWWGIGLLAFAAGAAAWWAVSRHETMTPEIPQDMEKTLSTPMNHEPAASRHGVNHPPRENTDTQSQEAMKDSHETLLQPAQVPEDKSSVIYKREVY